MRTRRGSAICLTPRAVLTPYAPLAANMTYAVTVSGVKDTVGNALPQVVTSTFSTIDTIAPSITALTATGDRIKGGAVTVTAAVGDADTAFVDFFVDDQLVATDATQPFVQSITLAKEGTVYLRAVAQDKAGNRGLSYPQPAMAIVVAPDEAPSATIPASSQDGSVIAGSTVTVTIQATDDLSVKEIILTASGDAVFSQTKTNLSGKTYSTTFSVARTTTRLNCN